ncbi:MAG: hypothetical protein H6707_14660 [Deltaproteobacteria bacterium]|nr:hypothetical protein [Deltaproteobacteria bacterium]
MLRVMRGEPIKHKVVVEAADKRGVVRQVVREEMIYPDFATRLEAAKSCSAFFAPRLAAQAIRADMQDGAIAAALLSLAHKLPV